MKPCLKIPCAMVVALLLAASFSGCGGGKPVPEAKKAVKAGAETVGENATESSDLGSERYLPRDERFRRRQQAILTVLDRFGSAPVAMK